MNPPGEIQDDSGSTFEADLRRLYQELLDRWNSQDAVGMAGLFQDEATVIGFDGSQMNGRQEIAGTLGQIFADHQTAAYLSVIRELRELTPGVVLIRSVVGMVPAGQSDLNPAVNAVQTVVAVKQDEGWRIAVFQNTPAAYHGRPELAEKLTQELREQLPSFLRNQHGSPSSR